MGKEIERKWLLKKLPDEIKDASVHLTMNTIYMSIEKHNGDILSEVRIRRTDDGRPDKITYKSGGLLSREEFEENVSPNMFDSLIESGKTSITKDFYVVEKNGYRIQMSTVDYGKFIYAEVEFGSEEEAAKYEFPWPDLVKKDVTFDKYWKMANYYLRKQKDNKSVVVGKNKFGKGIFININSCTGVRKNENGDLGVCIGPSGDFVEVSRKTWDDVYESYIMSNSITPLTNIIIPLDTVSIGRSHYDKTVAISIMNIQYIEEDPKDFCWVHIPGESIPVNKSFDELLNYIKPYLK